MKQGKVEFYQENALVIANWSSQKTSLHMDITKRSILKSDLYSLQPKMENLYTVSKNNLELTVAQIMNFLLQNSDLN